MKRLVCIGGKLDSQYLELDDGMHYVVMPEMDESPFGYDHTNAHEMTFRQVTYTEHKWAAVREHPCVREAALIGTWQFLALALPNTREGERAMGRIIMQDPPHSGWKPKETRLAASPEWWFWYTLDHERGRTKGGYAWVTTFSQNSMTTVRSSLRRRST
jgi:hypothetical protein